MPFAKGVSGNPAGRPKGCRDHATREMLKYRGLALRVLIRHVRRGSIPALTLLLDRVFPKPRSVAPAISLSGVSTRDLAKFGRRVLRNVAGGKISPDVGNTLLASLASQAALVQHVDLAARIEALEADEPRGVIPLRRRGHDDG